MSRLLKTDVFKLAEFTVITRHFSLTFLLKTWHVSLHILTRVLHILTRVTAYLDTCPCISWHVSLRILTRVTAYLDTCPCISWHVSLRILTRVTAYLDTCLCISWHVSLYILTRVTAYLYTCHCISCGDLLELFINTNEGSILNIHRPDHFVSSISYLHLEERFFAEAGWSEKFCQTKSYRYSEVSDFHRDQNAATLECLVASDAGSSLRDQKVARPRKPTYELSPQTPRMQQTRVVVWASIITWNHVDKLLELRLFK
jgi:hypothetical protein